MQIKSALEYFHHLNSEEYIKNSPCNRPHWLSAEVNNYAKNFLPLSLQTKLLLSLSASKSNTVRIVIDELQPIKARYRVPDVIVGEPQDER